MIAILDYGSGNLRSVQRAFATASREVIVTSDPQVCERAKGLVIPGVGAFAACMNQLRAINGGEIIESHIAVGKKILGICVGMQILFNKGFEKITSQGLGILKGNVELLPAKILPHIGWNQVETGENSTLFNGIERERFYFVHSYGVLNPVDDALNSYTDYEGRFISAVETKLVSAVQFHPEKSSAAGMKLIRNWVESL
ncbi:MAG: imidazole glycerol phosphate synthase subunit HisH [Actinobacteria bacterium]|nr:imidazole glycerol phosphate synthase subunit HisH [Actinomycetota bacterium]